MIELPIDNTPSKEFSVNTPVGVLRFRTQWDSFLGQWYMDIMSPTGETWINRVALTAGVDNLLAGCGVPELRDCAMFAIDTKDVGVRANATVAITSKISQARRVEKLDTNGKIIWARTWDHVTEAPTDGFIRGDGENVYYVYGYDVYKLDTTGAVVWSKTVATSTPRIGMNLSRTALYTAGFAGPTISRRDANGDVVSSFDIDAALSIRCLCADDTGNVFVGCTSDFGVNKYVKKYNSSGVLQWTCSYGTAGTPESIVIDSSGNSFISTNDGKVRKINSSGTNTLTITTVAASVVYGLALDSSGNIYAAGSNWPTNGKFGKYNSSGVLQWEKTLAGADSTFTGVAVDSSGNVFLSGALASATTSLWSYNSSGTLRWSLDEGYYTDPVYPTLIRGGSVALDSFGNIRTNCKNATSTKTVSIGSVVYSFKDAVSSAYDVLIGTTDGETLTNLLLAINASGTAGVNYGTGTAAHPDVYATPLDTDATKSIMLVSKGSGVAGSAITIFQSGDTEFALHLMALSGASLEYGNDHGGNHKLDLYNDIGKTYRVFMTFPDDTVLNPFTTTF